MGVLETSLHEIAYAALYRQREREREAENGRRNKEARRNGEQVEGGEIDTRVVCGSPRVEYVLPRGVGLLARGPRPQMGQVVSRWWKRPINRGN